jgi:DNA-binding transcriptional MerR regulator
MPMKQIAAALGVSPGSVHRWTRDVPLNESRRTQNVRLARERFAARWIEINRQRRLGYQAEGRARAQAGDAFHQAGLYDARILQQIYGAIQEYAGFDEPRWLDGPPRTRR